METDLLVSFAKLIIKSLVKKGMLWHFWYFGALLLIYICVPLLNKHRERLNRIWIAFFAFGFLAQLGSYIIGTPLQSYCIQTFRLWTWIQYFILGGLCGREWRHPERNVTLKAHTYSVALASAFVVLYQNIVGRFLLHNLYAEYFYDSVFTILWVVVLFTWIMRLNLSLKLNNIIRRLSPLTMGIYIIHPLLIRIGAHFIKIDNILFSLIYFIAILLVSGLLAGILSRIPLMNKLIKL
jgi:surface polysaccharide O-acyltransferase-like enzyme